IATWILLGSATLKALLTLVLLGPGERPGLLVENNFELALFSGLVAVLYRHMPRSRGWAVALLGLLVILTGSRSGAMSFFIVAVYAILMVRLVSRTSKYLRAAAISALTVIPVAVFLVRTINSQFQIDR